MHASGATHLPTDSHSAQILSSQQFPSLSQNSFNYNNHALTGASQGNLPVHDMENTQILSNDALSRATRKLSEEELQQEQKSAFSLEDENKFPGRHFSRRKLEKLLKTYFISVAVANILSLAFISFLYPLVAQFVILMAAVILICLCVGVIAESEKTKIFSWVFFLVLWACGGYLCGSYFYNVLGGGTNHAVEICIGLACAITTALMSGRFHLRLF